MGEAAAQLLERGSVLGRYVVLELLGEGGMGVVYAAYDPQLDRKVALKLLRADLAGDEGQQRLLREAQALARLAHPNVVAVHDVGLWNERVFIAMEFIDGVTLSAWLKAERRSSHQILEVLRDAGRGLSTAHAAGLVHRDFKPDNVMVDRDGRARVVDFSLVYAAGAAPGPAPPGSPVTGALTQSGVVLGTPLYMPLEVLEGAPADARADQYGFCVTLFEALYGELPVQAATLEALHAELAAGRPRRPPARAGVPTRVRRALARGLAARPEDRFAGMEELLRALAIGPRWSRLVFVGLAIGLGAVAVGAVLARELRERRALLCSGGSARVASAWGPARRAQGAAAFAALGRPYAAATWERVAALLDDYSASWQDAFRSTCEATRLRGEQSEQVMGLRMECLDHRLAALGALTELFGRADALTVEKGVSAAAGLPAIAGCAEVAALAARLTPPPPPQRDAVAALRGRLARAEAQIEAGRYAEARPLGDELVAEARRLAYRPALAEALFVSGVIDARASKFIPAEGALREAISTAEASRHDELAAQIWPELVELQGCELVHLVDARSSEARGLAALDRIGEEGVTRARLLDAIGLLRKEEGKHAEAVEQHRAALALAERRLGPVHPLVGVILGHLANALREADRIDESMATYRRALEVQEHARGADHPDLAEVLAGLAVTRTRVGAYDEALALNRRALEIRERAFGPMHNKVALSLNNLALVMRWQGRPADALPLLERSLVILSASAGADSPEVAAVHNNLGFTQVALGRHAEAQASYERALKIRERALGEDHPTVAVTLSNLGNLALVTHHPEVALADYRRALAIDEKTGNVPTTRAYSLVGIGQALLALGRADEALRPLEEGHQIRQQGVPPLKLAEAEQHLARALWQTGRDRTRALTLARSALGRCQAAGKPGEGCAAELGAWLRAR
jgi:tetratricopeptide (TPR) repeat protein/predicted Ser/Thr protein kinase